MRPLIGIVAVALLLRENVCHPQIAFAKEAYPARPVRIMSRSRRRPGDLIARSCA